MIQVRNWWIVSFAIFTVLSLSSMAGMSIGGGIYLACSLIFLKKFWRAPEGDFFRRTLTSPYALITYFLFFVSFLSLLNAALFPPWGPEAHGFSELKKYHHFLYPLLVALGLQFATKNKESVFWKWWMVIGFLCIFMAIIQFWGGSLFPAEWLDSKFFRQSGNSGRYHAQGLMFFHLSFASCMPFVAAPGLARALWPARGDSFRARMLWLSLGLGGALATFYTYSRIGWVALVVLLVTLGFLKKPKYGLFTLIFMCVVFLTTWHFSDSMRRRWNEANAGIFERKIVWAGAWEMFKERPVLGVGQGRTGLYSAAYSEKVIGRKPEFSSHAHNNFLDIMASMGTIGLAAFLLWWGYLFLEASLAFRSFSEGEKWLPAAAIAGFISFHINGLTQVNFWDGKSQHTLMIWCGVIVYLWFQRTQGSFKKPQ